MNKKFFFLLVLSRLLCLLWHATAVRQVNPNTKLTGHRQT